MQTLNNGRPLPYVSFQGDSLVSATLELRPGGVTVEIDTFYLVQRNPPAALLHIGGSPGTWSVDGDSLRFVSPGLGHWACKRTGDILRCPVGNSEWLRR
jgi:hypothetical protein